MARNVYFNPNRSDQALVHMTSGRWEVMPLAEATRLIFDGVAKAMVRVMVSNEEKRSGSGPTRALPKGGPYMAAAAGGAERAGDGGADVRRRAWEYAKRAKVPMATHLTNCRDAVQIGQ